MAAITLRSAVGRPLTNSEVDANFSALNSELGQKTDPSNFRTINGSSILGSGDIAIAGGGGTPGGSNTQLQFNSGGAFGGSDKLTFDGTTLKAGPTYLATPSTKSIATDSIEITDKFVNTSTVVSVSSQSTSTAGNSSGAGALYGFGVEQTAVPQSYIQIVNLSPTSEVYQNLLRASPGTQFIFAYADGWYGYEINSLTLASVVETITEYNEYVLTINFSFSWTPSFSGGYFDYLAFTYSVDLTTIVLNNDNTAWVGVLQAPPDAKFQLSDGSFVALDGTLFQGQGSNTLTTAQVVPASIVAGVAFGYSERGHGLFAKGLNPNPESQPYKYSVTFNRDSDCWEVGGVPIKTHGSGIAIGANTSAATGNSNLLLGNRTGMNANSLNHCTLIGELAGSNVSGVLSNNTLVGNFNGNDNSILFDLSNRSGYIALSAGTALGVVWIGGAQFSKYLGRDHFTGNTAISGFNLINGIISSASSTPITLTVPSGSVMTSQVHMPLNFSFDFSLMNLGSSAGTVTIAGNTNFSTLGNMLVQVGTSGRFRVVRVGSAGYQVIRIS